MHFPAGLSDDTDHLGHDPSIYPTSHLPFGSDFLMNIQQTRNVTTFTLLPRPKSESKLVGSNLPVLRQNFVQLLFPDAFLSLIHI